MSNNGKPTALQTDGQKATSAFESFLAPEEDTQEEAVIEEAESIEPEIDELEEQDDLGTEEGYPMWWTLNTSAQYKFNDNLKIQVSVENILDQHYRSFASGISAPGRNIIVSLRSSF